MAGDIRRGSIVWVEVSDPGQDNEKIRPAIVVEISASQTLLLVCASTKFEAGNLREDEFYLPHANPPAKCNSGLTCPTVAKCRWIRKVAIGDVKSKCGYLTNDCLQAILAIAFKLNQRLPK